MPERPRRQLQARDRLIPPRLGPVLVLVTVLVLTAVAVATAARRNDDRRRAALDRAARGAAEAIDRRMRAYTEILYATASLFGTSGGVDARQFHDFVRSAGTLERYPGVRALGFARYQPGPPRRLLIERLEPPPGAAPGLGVDYFAEPNRRQTALRAARSGRAEGTAPLTALQRTTTQRVFLIMVPVYAPGARWMGVAFAGFRMGDLLRGVLGAVPRDVDLEVYDVGRPSGRRVDGDMLGAAQQTYNLRGGRDAGMRDADDSRVATLDVAGRRWAVYYAQTHGALSSVERAAPWTIAAGGLVLALLAAALLRSQVTSEERAVALADRRTAELRERERELERSNEELEHFAYLASHDLQEPLRTITAYGSLLERRLGDGLDERTSSWLGFVTDGAHRMSALIADLLEYSRAGRGGEEPVPVDLGEAWDAAVGNLERAIGEAGGTVTRGALPVVAGNRRAMVSLLQNLISNGLKYHDSRAPAVHADAVRTGLDWELRVSDNGIGIETRFHDRIFGLFQRLHTSDEYPGTGMGLAIVKKLAEANGGSVRVQARPGGGSTFVVALPVPEET